ncbi:MAG: 50S ribosomal protein L19 [Endomicrobium sp.]|jgi:large subunit ribosomal protein L19|nr:50S ribosomal protein L19 [Endomicrobium sp.]
MSFLNNVIDEFKEVKNNKYYFKVGDQVKVHFKIIEGKNEKVQLFEGIIIKIKGSKISKTFTIRKISYGIAIERIFPIFSPNILKVEITRYGLVRRSKLYYLRKLFGKAAKIKPSLNKRRILIQ